MERKSGVVFSMQLKSKNGVGLGTSCLHMPNTLRLKVAVYYRAVGTAAATVALGARLQNWWQKRLQTLDGSTSMHDSWTYTLTSKAMILVCIHQIGTEASIPCVAECCANACREKCFTPFQPRELTTLEACATEVNSLQVQLMQTATSPC